MRKRKKTGISSNRGVRTAKKFDRAQLEWRPINVESACRVFWGLYRCYQCYEFLKSLIEQHWPLS